MANHGARIGVACVIVCTASCLYSAVGAELSSDESLVIEEFDMPVDGDMLAVPVTVDETERTFCVDTGCTGTVYDRSLRPLLGEPIRTVSASSLSASFRTELFRAPAARLGRLELHPREKRTDPFVACLDLSGCSRASDLDVRGIIGRDFLKRHVIRLDFDTGKLQLRTAPGEDAGTLLRVEYVKNIPLIRVELPVVGLTYFQFDTGLSGDSGSLHVDHVAELENRGQLCSIGTTKRATATGVSDLRTLRLSSLRLGDFEHSDLIFTEHSGNTPSSLGLGYCSRYVITLDLGNAAVYLKPSKSFARREPFPHADGASRFGVIVARQNDQAVILATKVGGPADAAGLVASDRLLAVNGTDVSHLRRYPILTLFGAAGDSVRLTIERNGQRRDIVVTLPPSSAVGATKDLGNDVGRQAARGERVNGTAVIAEYPLDPHGDAILVPVRISGSDFFFLLTTGATNTVYDVSLRSRLGPVVARGTINGHQVKADIVSSSGASIAGLPLPDRGFLSDLRIDREVFGYDVRGLVGMDFLCKHILKLDFDAGKFQLVDACDEEAGTEVPLVIFADGLPYAQVEIHGGRKDFFLVDTGDIGLGTDGNLDRKIARRILAAGEAEQLRPTRIAVFGGSETTAANLRLRGICLHGFRHEGIGFSTASTGNALGNRYWSRYIVTFDFPRRRMFLKESTGYAAVHKTDGSGLHFRRVDGRNIIDFVDHGSAADNEAITAGDMLLSVGNLDSRTSTPRSLRLALCRSGRAEVVIERDGKRLNLSLHLDPK